MSNGAGPTVPPPQPGSLNTALARNIETLRARALRERGAAPLQERIAAAITDFAGSIRSVGFHLLLYGFWVSANLGWMPGVAPWDSSFVVLAMVASVEAIFLSTFVLITQNRMAEESEHRAALDLQINLLAEHEVTKLIAIVTAIAQRLEVQLPLGGEIEELQRDVAPEAVLDALQEEERTR